MTDKEICPKCHKTLVYAEHYKDEWFIRCCHCNLQTHKCDSWESARKAWDRIVQDMRDATPEELEEIDKYIKSISKPTGVNFWNLTDDKRSK